MACKRSAVRSRLPPPRNNSFTMHKLGVISVLLGLALSIVGLIVGFTLAIGSGTGEQWFTLVPFGFVFLLLGVTLTQLGKK